LPYAGDPDQPATLLTALGTAWAAHLYPQTAAADAIAGGLPGARVCFVGVRGQADYNAAFVARSVGRLSATGVLPARFETASVEFAMPGVRHPYNRSAMELAQLLDDESTLAEATAALGEALPRGVTHVALPPIWGVERAPQALSATQAALGVPCFEPLAVPPSVPGFRLQRALDRALERAGVRVIHATVTSFVAEERRVTRVEATEKETRHAFIPRAVVLATGKFVGGGLARDEHLRETVLGLPVFVGDEIVTDQPVQEYLAPQFGDDQPLMRAGVRVDDSLRPVDEAGDAVYENVWAAGGVRAGYPADHGALGAALVEGFIVGARALS